MRRGTLNRSPATSPTIQSKATTIDLPSTSKRSCRKRSVCSFMATKPLQLTKKTQQDGSWIYRLQAHLPRQFKYPQRQFSSSIIKWRFQTTCMKTTHMASKGCIAFLRSLTFTTASMCKFTIILAEAVKLCIVTINRKFFHLFRVVAKKFFCRLAEKLSRLKKARSAFCHRRSRRRAWYGRGSPLPLGGYGGPPQEILKILIQFGVLW